MRRALLVGVDDYPTAPLLGCVDDAIKLANLLKTNHDGSPNFHCRVLLAPVGDDQQVTKSSLRQKLGDLLSSEADLALFYFSGHGAQDDSQTFLVTQDHQPHDMGVNVEDVLKLANKSLVKEVVIILDTCHSGAMGQTSFTQENTALLREGITILTASRKNQVAIVVGNSSLFTTLVCEALEGGASDVVGEVNVASIYSFADQTLDSWEQRPLFKSHVSKLSPIRMAKPSVPLDVLRELPKLFPNPNEPLQLDPSFEPDRSQRPIEFQNVEKPENEQMLWKLQKLRDGRLLVPIGEEHLFYAAIHSKQCQLTTLGKFYWQRVSNNKL